MDYGLFDVLKLIGSLGVFIYGMKIMSEGLQRAAGDKLRKILRGMTSTRVSGVFTGFLTTALIQSSSATTVMVVSFVNAGLLTLGESMGVIMGANIGTTVTAWLISLLGFKFQITDVAIVLIGISFPLLFSKKDGYKNLAEFVIGFGILFIGLDFLKASVPDIKQNPEILTFLQPLTDNGIWSTLLFVAVGTLLTIVIQSSSATMAVTLVMLMQGWIDFPIAAAMVLGENIGTTITANIAAVVANIHAKRAALFHLFFNLIGVFWMLLVMQWFLHGIDDFLVAYSSDHQSVFSETIDAKENALLALSFFHSSFNILNVLLLIWFVPLLEKLVIRMLPSKGDSDEEFRLKYISSGVMSTPEMSLAQARKELQLFAKLIDKMSLSFSALLYERHKNQKNIIDKIARREEITDNLEIELVTYLTKVSESDLSRKSTEKIRSMISMANDLERIADLFHLMSKNYQRMLKAKVKLPDEVLDELKELLDLVYAAIKLMRENLDKEPEDINLKEEFELEERINKVRKELVKAHYVRLEKNEYSPMAGVIYLDFVNRAERIGDHIINVHEAAVGLK